MRIKLVQAVDLINTFKSQHSAIVTLLTFNIILALTYVGLLFNYYFGDGFNGKRRSISKSSFIEQNKCGLQICPGIQCDSVDQNKCAYYSTEQLCKQHCRYCDFGDISVYDNYKYQLIQNVHFCEKTNPKLHQIPSSYYVIVTQVIIVTTLLSLLTLIITLTIQNRNKKQNQTPSNHFI